VPLGFPVNVTSVTGVAAFLNVFRDGRRANPCPWISELKQAVT
jgi:hypothetical protein